MSIQYPTGTVRNKYTTTMYYCQIKQQAPKNARMHLYDMARWRRVTSLLLGVVMIVYMVGNFRALRDISDAYLQRSMVTHSVTPQKIALAAEENDLVLDVSAASRSPQTFEIEKLNATVVHLENQLEALKATLLHQNKLISNNYDSNVTAKLRDSEGTNTPEQTESSSLTWIEQKETLKAPEFPFPKTCVFEQPPSVLDTVYDIAVFYHVGFINNWRNIVWDQLDSLEVCGLGYMASSMTVSHHTPPEDSNGTLNELVQMINDFPFSAQLNISYMEATTFPYEKNILDSVSRTCRSSQSESRHDDTKGNETKWADKKRLIVYYFHNKGCTKETKSSTYNNVLHWRRYMEWFILEKPTLCLRAMLYYGASTCGVNFSPDPPFHYSGNFWASSCDWILNLPVEVESGDYYAAEMWIGKSIQDTTEVNYTKHINLFNSAPFGNTYEVPIVPENYGNLNEHKTGKYGYLWTDYLMNLNGAAVAN